MQRPIGPISQAFANERYNGLVKDNAAGQDVLAALNMFWLYFRDNPRAWHPAISFRYSMYQAAAIMGLNWHHQEWTFKPRYKHVHQMRIYGIEEDRETGRLVIKSVWRWRHALGIARQTGRCPPSTFAKRLGDPDCEPDDPVDPLDLPPLHRGWTSARFKAPERYSRAADPRNIEKEMIERGHKEHTYDAKRANWFRHEAAAKEPRLYDSKNLSFASAARSVMERLAR